jgi:hypothetical protein
VLPPEPTVKELAQLRHAQKQMGALLANVIPDDDQYERRKSVVQLGKDEKRAKKLAKKLARRAA